MAETGDWVTPRLYGKPWFEKPPLFYWGAALSFKLFGVSEAAARLPSAISALLATLALAWLALRLYGAETARWLLLLLPTTVGMIGFSHAAATDMPFSGMLTIAMVCAAVVLGLTRNENSPILPRTPWLALILFGFFLGLAVLAKGPRRNHSQRRRSILLGTLHKTLARRLPPFSSGSHRRFLLNRTPLVYPLRAPQSRFLPHLHHRAQFQTLFDARIPAHPTSLVLHPGCPRRFHALDRAACVLAFERITKSLANPQYRRIQFVFTLLGRILRGFLYRLAFKVARLRASRHSCHRHASRPRSESEASTEPWQSSVDLLRSSSNFRFHGNIGGSRKRENSFRYGYASTTNRDTILFGCGSRRNRGGNPRSPETTPCCAHAGVDRSSGVPGIWNEGPLATRRRSLRASRSRDIESRIFLSRRFAPKCGHV